jgi:hypothetical protein
MDFELLYTLIPKPSLTWSVQDIETWLEFIGLSQYAPQFSNSFLTQKRLPSTVAAFPT